jgi:hypothetical protein
MIKRIPKVKKKVVAKVKKEKPVTTKSNMPLIEILFNKGHKWCCVCGGTNMLTFSHLFKTNQMKGNTRWDYDNVENGLLMCMPCHTKFDGLSNSIELGNPETRIGFILANLLDAYAKRVARRMLWLCGGSHAQEKIHEDISNG